MNFYKATHRLLPVLMLAFALAVLANPAAAAAGFAAGVRLCLHSVLPALFPFFVVCEILLATPLPPALFRPLAKILGLQSPDTACALALSWLGGYAACARLAATLRGSGRIPQRDAALLLLLGCCSGPGFVVGCVGGLLLGNVRLGWLLYAAQLAANLLAAALLLPFLPPAKFFMPGSAGVLPRPRPVGLPAAIGSAVDSSLAVVGSVVFFRMVCAVAAPLLPQVPWAGAVLSAAMEVSSGCADFAALGGGTALYGCCACLSLLGASVWAQIGLLGQGRVPWGLLAAHRLLHLALYQGLVRLLAQVLPGTAAVYATLQGRVVATTRLPPDAAAVAFIFLCAALYKARRTLYNSKYTHA